MWDGHGREKHGKRSMRRTLSHLLGRLNSSFGSPLRASTNSNARRFLVVAVLVVAIPAFAAAPPLEQSLTRLIEAAGEYRTALEHVLPFRERELARATENLARRRELAAQGIVARREVDEAERAVAVARENVAQLHRDIAQTELTIVEARAREQLAHHAPGSPPVPTDMLVSEGTHAWSLGDTSTIERFFSTRFGRPLPVSAFGQTPVHDRLGFDHRNAIDVAVHPDSVEGQALLAYLRGHGVPFMAFRSARAGVSTGAHIHIGDPSPRRG